MSIMRLAKFLGFVLFLFAVLIVFGNDPWVKKSRKAVNKSREVIKAVFIPNFNDAPEGLSIKKQKAYLGKLRSKYKDFLPVPQMIDLPAGSYLKGCKQIGCDKSFPDVEEKTVKAFRIAATEVTVEAWDTCVAFSGCNHMPVNYGWGRGDLPVLNVSWVDVMQYILWLNAMTGDHYRLPTDVEWEYAAKAGTVTAYPWGDEVPACDQARLGTPNWKDKDERSCLMGPTWSVASGEPNAWGLYHVIGNAAEWTSDCGKPKRWKSQASFKTKACVQRINRGGNWATGPKIVNIIHSRAYMADHRYNRVGFRLALD